MALIQSGYLVPPDVSDDFGFQTSIIPPNPAAGASFKRVVPGAFFEIPVFVQAVLTTSATVFSRLIRLVVQNSDGQGVVQQPAFGLQAASVQGLYLFSTTVGAAFSPTTNQYVMPLFPIVIPAGWSLQVVCDNLQAGDQISGISIVVQQFNTGLQQEHPVEPRPVDLSTVNTSIAPSLAPAPAPAPAPTTTVATPTPTPTTTTTTTTTTAPAPSPTELGPGSSAGSSPGTSRL